MWSTARHCGSTTSLASTTWKSPDQFSLSHASNLKIKARDRPLAVHHPFTKPKLLTTHTAVVHVTESAIAFLLDNNSGCHLADAAIWHAHLCPTYRRGLPGLKFLGTYTWVLSKMTRDSAAFCVLYLDLKDPVTIIMAENSNSFSVSLLSTLVLQLADVDRASCELPPHPSLSKSASSTFSTKVMLLPSLNTQVGEINGGCF